MAKNKDGVEQPDMINSKKYRDGYDEIIWDAKTDYCVNCGSPINRETALKRPELFVFYETGEIEHKSCNFN